MPTHTGPWELYESVFMQLLERCQAEISAHSHGKFRFKNKLMSLDGSIIELSATMFDWAKYRQRKGAIKLHLLLDHDGYLPSFAVVTDGKHSELKVARGLRLEAGTILAIDRGYNDYEWFADLTRDGVFFVTRMKTNTVYERQWRCVRFQKRAMSSATRSFLCLLWIRPERLPSCFGGSNTGTRTNKKSWCSSPIFCTWRPRRLPRSTRTAGRSACPVKVTLTSR